MSAAALVRRFYDEAWNDRSEAAAHEILAPDLAFRGSLGAERTGVPAFLAYVADVHAALAGYRCDIEDLIEAEDRAAARVRFSGAHVGPFLGVPASGRAIAWTGAAFFTLHAARFTQIWVVADLAALRNQLGG